MTERFDALTEKEKRTLRLMGRGHDAKSAAAALELSVHTINERLRAARRKLEVTSSREAARLMMEHERHQISVDKDFRGAASPTRSDGFSVPETLHAGEWGKGRAIALITGAVLMSIIAAAMLLTTPVMTDRAGSPRIEETARDTSLETAARKWLALVEAKDWEASYAATAASFRKANTLELWSDSAESVHGALGRIVSRQFVGADDVPSPQGITIVKFRSDYTNRRNVIVTVSLVEEDGAWKVAGIYVS